MTRWEISFIPAKRFVRGEHQPDISYLALAADLASAKVEAVKWLLACQHNGYRFHNAKQVAA